MSTIRDSASNSRPVRLSPLAVPPGLDASMRQFLTAVKEHLEVRDGARGNPYERAVIVRDMVGLGLDLTNLDKKLLPGAPGRRADPGVGSPVFGSVGAPRDIEALIRTSLTAEASRLGASIRRVEHKLQSEIESSASVLQQITASLGDAQAGIRELSYVSATANRATAGRITQMVVALSGLGEATFLERVALIADRLTGLSASYYLRLSAGNAVTGYSLLASEDPSGASVSQFVVEAGQFIVTAPVTFESETTPSATAIGQIWFNPTTKAYSRATATGTGGWVPYTRLALFEVNTTTGVVSINADVVIGGTLAASSVDTTEYVRAQGFLDFSEDSRGLVNSAANAAIVGENSSHGGYAIVGRTTSPIAEGAGYFECGRVDAKHGVMGVGFFGVIGQGRGTLFAGEQSIGVYGGSGSVNGIGVLGVGGGAAISCQGKFRFGAYDIVEPSGAAHLFLANTGSWTAVDWFNLTNRPSTFPPDPHSHPLEAHSHPLTSIYSVGSPISLEFSTDGGGTWAGVLLR